MNVNLSITGINNQNLLSLTGKQESNKSEPIYIKKIKERIFNLYILPLQTNNWEVINQNMFAFNDIYQRLQKYIKINTASDLTMYFTVIQTISELNGEYSKFNQDNKEIFNGLAKFRQYLPTIRLSPAYELYNLILGRPLNSDYDDFIISHINALLMNDNITFSEIKKFILEISNN